MEPFLVSQIELDKNEYQNEFLVKEIKDNVTRGLIHEWARQHGYLSRTWYVKDYSQFMIKCNNKKCGKEFTSDKFQDVASVDHECLMDFGPSKSHNFACRHCNTIVYPKMDTELKFKWIASDSMLLMKRASSSYDAYKTREGAYRRRRRGLATSM